MASLLTRSVNPYHLAVGQQLLLVKMGLQGERSEAEEAGERGDAGGLAEAGGLGGGDQGQQKEQWGHDLKNFALYPCCEIVDCMVVEFLGTI